MVIRNRVRKKTKKIEDKTGKGMIGQERNENNKSKKNIHKNLMERKGKINKCVKITESQSFGHTGIKRERIKK